MLEVSHVGTQFYTVCCHRYKVRPNASILDQVGRTDFLNLRRIDGSRTFLGSMGVRAVLEFVRQHRVVEELDLQRNGVDGSCVEHLCEIIASGHPSLRSINLAGNELSVPAVRKLWECARVSHTLTSLRLEGCGIPPEWIERIQRLLSENEELRTRGFFAFGPERPLRSWHTVFLLLIGSDPRVDRFCRGVLPVLSSYLAPMRVRVAPIVVGEAVDVDPTHVLGKVSRCREQANQGLTWCVALVGGKPLAEAQRLALGVVLSEPPAHIEPLKSKLGVYRDAVQKPVVNCFVYHCCPEDLNDGVRSVTPERWLRMVGYSGVEYEKLCGAAQHQATVLLEEAYHVRCPTDLLSSWDVLFREDPARAPLEQCQDSFPEQDRAAAEVALGALHVNKAAFILNYVNDKSCEYNAPLVMYGAGGIGKGYLLSHVATRINDDEGKYWRPALLCVNTFDASAIIFLYRLLTLVDPTASLQWSNIRELCKATRSALEGYCGAPKVLLIARVDALDFCGAEASIGIDWVPGILPANLKLVLSLNTESPLLHLIRQRFPQPLECLVPPVSELNRIEQYRLSLQSKGISLPGLKGFAESKRRVRVLTMTEEAFVKKWDAGSFLYTRLAGVFTALRLGTHVREMTGYDVTNFIDRELPETSEELVAGIVTMSSQIYDGRTIKHVLLALAIAPLPVPQLQFVCEDLNDCTPYSTIPNLLMLVDHGLLEWNADAQALMPHRVVRNKILSMYAEGVDGTSVMLESHLYRLVVTDSHESPTAFQHLIPVMISNGSFTDATQLVQNTAVMDRLITRRPSLRVYLIDSLCRLILSWDLLCELSIAGHPLDVKLDVSSLAWALTDAQRFKGGLFQSAVLQTSDSPYTQSAFHSLGEAMYPVLVPTNRGSEESSARVYYTEEPCSYLHHRDHQMVVTTATSVVVFETETAQVVATLATPFRDPQTLVAALMAVGTHVVILSTAQVLLWDYVANTFNVLDGTVAAPDTAMNTFGTELIVTNPHTGAADVIDVPQHRVSMRIPPFNGVRTRIARFCGLRPLLVGVTDVHLFASDDAEPTVLPHDGLVVDVDCNSDARLIASSVGAILWVWASSGELLHRLETGCSVLSSLQFNHSGAYLIARGAQTMQLWRTTSGTFLGHLQNPFKEESSRIDATCFSADDGTIYGIIGRRIVLWDGKECDIRGALTADCGWFKCMCARGGILFTASTENGVAAYDIASVPVPSLQEAKAGTLTTNWTRNAKVSSSPIRRISANANGTLLSFLSADGTLTVYATATGACLFRRDRSIRTAVMTGDDRVAYMEVGSSELRVQVVANRVSSLTACEVPKTLLLDGDMELCSSEDCASIGLKYINGGHSRLVVFDGGSAASSFAPTLRCQCVGHTGKLSFAFFFGCSAFAYTIGEDRYLRLWNLNRCVERAALQHPYPIEVAHCDTSGLLVCIDSAKDIHYVHVSNIASASRSAFVFTKIELPIITRYLVGKTVLQSVMWNNTYLMVNTDAGLLAITQIHKDEPIHEVCIANCTSLCMSQKDGTPYVLVGNESGEVLSMKVVSPRL